MNCNCRRSWNCKQMYINSITDDELLKEWCYYTINDVFKGNYVTHAADPNLTDTIFDISRIHGYFAITRPKLCFQKISMCQYSDAYCSDLDINIHNKAYVRIYVSFNNATSILEKIKNVEYVTLILGPSVTDITVTENVKDIWVYYLWQIQFNIFNANIVFSQYKILPELEPEPVDIHKLYFDPFVDDEDFYLTGITNECMKKALANYRTIKKLSVRNYGINDDNLVVHLGVILSKGVEVFKICADFDNTPTYTLVMTSEELHNSSLREIELEDSYDFCIDGVIEPQNSTKVYNYLFRNRRDAEEERFKKVKPILY